MNDIQSLTNALQTAGLRLTPQRLAICRLLASSDQHPTAQLIYDTLRPDFPSLSLATVYNTLDTLVSLGAINSLGGAGDDAVHYDADTSPHVNLACTRCHRVIDLPSRYVESLEDEVAATSGYRILGARVLYYGLCPDCLKAGFEIQREHTSN
jgi:Fur family peroxide stress response transcriptional regulator